MPLITLTTDFGLEDPYVAAMKGVILSIQPKATIVDISHQVAPQHIPQAAFLLGTVYKYFPPDTIHVAVVDPGVGTGRRAVLLLSPRGSFLAPDNGLLSYVLGEEGSRGGDIRPPLRAFSLTNPRYWLKEVSATFHGRDIFAPVAAHLSLGIPPEELGEPVSSLMVFPLPRARAKEGVIRGEVLHIDHFGNLVTSLRKRDLPQGKVEIHVKGWRIEGLSPTYAEGGDLLALIGSSGHLEIAAQNASAARVTGVSLGEVIEVRGKG